MIPNSAHLSSINFTELISVKQASYAKCLDSVNYDYSCESPKVTTRCHHLKFDGNGVPMIDKLAELLYDEIVDYCLSACSRAKEPTTQDTTRYVKSARRLFTQSETGGDAGEILLYFLLECILQAPQVVAKMDLKTNPNDEVKGSDGIHMKWNVQDNLVDLYFGEAKLHQDIYSALTSTVDSIDAFHANEMLKHEYLMVTKHFKFADSKVKKAVYELFDSGAPDSGVRINHACLIGYDWPGYNMLTTTTAAELEAEFKEKYLADAPRIHKLLNKRFDEFERKHLHFEVFFIPFPAVQLFRDAFNAALK